MIKKTIIITATATSIAFLVGMLLHGPKQSFLLTFGTVYFFLCNGFFLYALSKPLKEQNPLETLTVSLLLSTSVNSLTIYLLNRYFGMPFTLLSALLTATTILVIIILYTGLHSKKPTPLNL